MDTIQIKDKLFTVSIREQEIQKEVIRVANEINRDLADKNPLFLSVLNGSFMFTADLLKHITIPCEISFVKLASYQGVTSTGVIKEVIGLNEDIAGRTVVIVEDIVDTGLTMQRLLETLGTRNPESIHIASLLVKPEKLKVDLNIDRPVVEKTRPLLEIRDLTILNDEGATAIDHVNFYIRGGEILGVAGIAGCGQRELCEAIAGLRPIQSGQMIHKGDNIVGLSPKAILDKGISMSFIPEDRLGMGLVASLGMVEGVGGGKFAPERTITRAEFTVMAMHFARLPEGGENPFSDVTSSDWFYDQVVGAVQYGWITGYTDGTFRPEATITRAEVTAITNRLLDRAADEDYVDDHAGELRQFPDVSPSYWAYHDIVEATNAHSYRVYDGEEHWM